MPYEKRWKETLLPVLRIRGGGGGGSGTVIYSKDASTFVLTNHHVVAGDISVGTRWSALLKRDVKSDITSTVGAHLFEYRYKSRNSGTRNVMADIVAYDSNEDLALLKLRLDDPVPATAILQPRGDEHKLLASMPVFAVGAGMSEAPVITSGMLSQFGIDIDNREYWLNTAPTIYGNSGGALFLGVEAGLYEENRFIGVPARIKVQMDGFSSDAITHLSYSIPITRVYAFLDEQRFRFIFDDEFTEEGEGSLRKSLRDEAEKLQLRESPRG